MKTIPKTIPEYLDQLRIALGKTDPAVLQDALFDAEDYLRSAIKEKVGRTEAEAIAEVASSYGDPVEVAEIYRDQETAVSKAIALPPAKKHVSALGKFFGVITDIHAYSAIFFMLLSLATGIFYFTWAVTGLSLSVGLSVLIIGVPFFLLFIGTVYVLSLLEGRIVEVLLGERMPRRPSNTPKVAGFLNKALAILKDAHTWGTLAYMILMLPLGIIYFTLAIVGLVVPIALAVAGFLQTLIMLGAIPPGLVSDVQFHSDIPNALAPVLCIVGVLLFFVMLHVARLIGKMHAALAKALLVRRAD